MARFSGVISKLFVQLALDDKAFKAGMVGARKTAEDTARRVASSAGQVEQSYARATRIVGAFQSALALTALGGAAAGGIAAADRSIRATGVRSRASVSLSQSNLAFKSGIARARLGGLTPLERLREEQRIERAELLQQKSAAAGSAIGQRATVAGQYADALLGQAEERIGKSRGVRAVLKAPISAAISGIAKRYLLSPAEVRALESGQEPGFFDVRTQEAFAGSEAQQLFRPGGLLDQRQEAERASTIRNADPSLGPRGNAELLLELQRLNANLSRNSDRLDETGTARFSTVPATIPSG